MASTIPLSRTINLASQFIRYSPLVFPANASTGAAATNDPAFSNADWVRQFILSAPFKWRWNRTESQFTCIVGQTDYGVSLPNLGWIEKAVIENPDNGEQTNELEVVLDIAVESVANQPVRIAAQLDDGAGNITFRLSPTPDYAYVVTVISQNAAATFTAASQTWAPIPDYYSFLFNQGFAAKCYEYANDPRYPQAMQLFLSQVVSADNGLSLTEKNIFLSERLGSMRETQAVQQGKS